MSQSIDVVIPAYNAAGVIDETVRLISAQQIPQGWRLNIFVSDDGSTDNSRQQLLALRDEIPELHVVCSDRNGGRGQACNRGVSAGSGAIVVICDADCRYTRTDAISEFVASIEQGDDVAIGLVRLAGRGFWARYTTSVAAERIRNESSKGLMSFTTANFAIRRSAYETLQGYSHEYAKYGFEDKDLLIRIDRSDLRVAVREDITVSHDDEFSLRAVCRKAEESGRHSAAIFRQRFPAEYRALPYARCDATLRDGISIPQSLAVPLQWATRVLAMMMLALPSVFFRPQRFLVRAAVCSAYFHGTARWASQKEAG